MAELLPLSTTPVRVKLRLEDYLLLDAAGAYDRYRGTELIEGDVYAVNAQHRPHARIKSRLYRLIDDGLRAANSPLEAMVEPSIAIPPDTAPEPDIVVTSEPEGDGLVPLPSVRLVVEVADTTLQADLTHKVALYAQAGIPEYWVVDVNARVIHQMWSPADATYVDRRQVAFGDPLAAATLAGVTIDTAGL